MNPHPDPRQSAVALAVANARRKARAQARRAMTLERALAILGAPPEWAATWALERFLRAVPYLGPLKIGRILGEAGLTAEQTIGSLSAAERAALARTLWIRRVRRARRRREAHPPEPTLGAADDRAGRLPRGT